jgi:hypothetical protein
VAEREWKPPNPPTRVDDVVIFPNGEVQQLTAKQVTALDRGDEVVLPMPPTWPWKEIIYPWPS